MYHYYVRCSFYKDGRKVGDWSCECVMEAPITDMSHIYEMQNKIETLVKSESYISFTGVLIDFYQLLRKDSD